MTGIELRSTEFNDHAPMPGRAAHHVANMSPQLSWSGVPEGTRELVLVCEDPDAGPNPFLHWLVTGIDPTANAVGEGDVPPGGQEWPNGFGEIGYGGPQPPVGDPPHRYFFRLYALAGPPHLPVHPDVPDVRQAVRGELASGTLVGTFGQ